MSRRFMLVLVLGLLCLNLIYANGLNIDLNHVEINKTSGTDAFVTLNIKNEETFKMYNVSFADTLIADKFDLEPGQTKAIQFKITSNENLDKDITLTSFYQVNLGQSNKTETVNIYYDSGLDKCDLNLVAGDSVKWINNVLGDVLVKNVDTGEQIKTILEGQNHTLKFQNPINFNYQVYRIGLPFTNVCNINVISTNGLVHNTEYDAKIHLKLNIFFQETSIAVNFPTTFYNLSYNEQYSDIFSIKNTGDKIAKNIKLNGDWLTFDTNNFDLQPQQQINVGYTVKPSVFNTNQTNQIYQKEIKIEGNFPTTTQNISVFVKYANLGTSGNASDINEDVIAYLIEAYCSNHPDFEWCQREVIYSNSTGGNVSIVVNEDVFKASLEEDAKFRDEVRTSIKQSNENDISLLDIWTAMQGNQTEANQNIKDTKDSIDNFILVIIFVFFVGCFIIAIGALAFFIIKKHKEITIFGKDNMKKSEKKI